MVTKKGAGRPVARAQQVNPALNGNEYLSWSGDDRRRGSDLQASHGEQRRCCAQLDTTERRADPRAMKGGAQAIARDEAAGSGDS